MPEPQSTCGACGQTDDHPKHQIALIGATQTSGQPIVMMYHEHDADHDGIIHYHFDCPSPLHDMVTNPARYMGDGVDPCTVEAEESFRARQLVAEIHAAKMAKAASGVHGDELRQWIQTLNVRGGAGGTDQTMATAILAALTPNSGTKTIGLVTITGPQKARLLTAIGSDTAAGTELATSGGYTAGGAALTMAAAAAGAVSSGAAVSWTNMPASTLVGMEQYDSSATPLRSFWGPWSGGNITVGAGNTFTIASGNYTATLS